MRETPEQPSRVPRLPEEVIDHPKDDDTRRLLDAIPQPGHRPDLRGTEVRPARRAGKSAAGREESRA